MSLPDRIPSALRAAGIHLGLSALVAVGVAGLVFGLWYPSPLHQLTGGQALFLILMAVDVVCGPVLTLVLYNPAKSRSKWLLDLGLIVLVQLGALAYGLTQVASARPVYLGFEGDRFRVVQAFDVPREQLHAAPEALRSLPMTGPEPLGVRLAQSTDPDYLASVQLALQGMHPSFRPSRWQTYDTQVDRVRTSLLPLSRLREKHPDRATDITQALGNTGLAEADVGYLPLVRDLVTDWVVLVHRSDGRPVGYLHLDGWP